MIPLQPGKFNIGFPCCIKNPAGVPGLPDKNNMTRNPGLSSVDTSRHDCYNAAAMFGEGAVYDQSRKTLVPGNRVLSGLFRLHMRIDE